MARRKDNIFTSVLLPKVKTNKFDLTHDVKMSFQMGNLTPTMAMEVLPGDRFTIRPENMLRFAPLISPVMHRVRIATHYYFVPNRILWAEWEKWITNESDVEAPYIQVGPDNYFPERGLADYLGYPTEQPDQIHRVSPIYLAAYRKVWDEYYRDQNLQDEIFKPLVPGNNDANYSAESFTADGVPRRAWEHDYFTSCLPFAQKGDNVSIPLVNQDNIPVDWNPHQVPNAFPQFREVDTGVVYDDSVQSSSDAPPSITVSGNTVSYDPKGTLTVDVQGDATDINTLRWAFRLQEWLERNARGGTRYVENILAHFGVKSSDARLQRPEYIGGVRQNMVISEVLSTAQNIDGVNPVPVGQMAGHGISIGGGDTLTYSAEEHGVIIGVISVTPDTAYQQGIHRQFTRFDRLDYAWPTFANLGEQEVKNKEVYMNHSDPEGTFGYIPRYSEYKYANSRVSGEMRGNLSFWHLGRIFQDEPTLSDEFIQCRPDPRIFAVIGEFADHLYAHIVNNVQVTRKLPRFGIPSI